MRRRRIARRPRVLSFALAAALAVVATPASAEPGVSIVSAGAARSLLGHRVASIRAYAFDREGAPRRIPLQVDERGENGRWVLDHGPKAEGDDQPGIVDEDDVLAIMNDALGEAATADGLAALPREASAWLEVRVGEGPSLLGYAYVGTFPPSSVDLPAEPVRYDAKKDAVFARAYSIEFDEILPTHVAFVDEFGNRGDTFVEATHAAGRAKLLGGVFEFERSHDDLTERIEGWRVGPVRSIRRGKYEVPLPLGFDASGRVDFLFYADFLEITGTLRLKVPPWIAGANGSLAGFVELPAKEAAKAMFAASAGAAATTSAEGRQWAALILPDGRTLVMVVRLGGSLGKMGKRFFLTEPPAAGEGSRFGFELSEANRLDAGEHPFAVVGAFLRDPDERTILRTARLLLDPPAVAVRKLAPEALSARAP